MNKAIGVLGCGWLGFPLAQSLLKGGFKVKGSTTSSEKLELLQKAGILPFLIELGKPENRATITSFLEDLDYLVINVPPQLKGKHQGNYIKKMEELLDNVKRSKTRKVLFISSTSVYGNAVGEVSEKTRPIPVSESGKQLLASEMLFHGCTKLQVSILRFGGLIGPLRHPSNQLAGRKALKNGDSPINLIHLDDCIHMIKTIIINEWWNEIFNGVYPYHPSKREYYASEAIKRGLKPPVYLEERRITKGKTVVSRAFLDKNEVFKTPISS